MTGRERQELGERDDEMSWVSGSALAITGTRAQRGMDTGVMYESWCIGQRYGNMGLSDE